MDVGTDVDIPHIQLLPGIPLCAGCVWALSVPSTLITVQDQKGERTIPANTSHTLALTLAAVNDGAQLLLDRRQTTFYAITSVHGTPACFLHMCQAAPTLYELW